MRSNIEIYKAKLAAAEKVEKRQAIIKLKKDLPSDLLNEELFRSVGMDCTWLDELKEKQKKVI